MWLEVPIDGWLCGSVAVDWALRVGIDAVKSVPLQTVIGRNGDIHRDRSVLQTLCDCTLPGGWPPVCFVLLLGVSPL